MSSPAQPANPTTGGGGGGGAGAGTTGGGGGAPTPNPGPTTPSPVTPPPADTNTRPTATPRPTASNRPTVTPSPDNPRPDTPSPNSPKSNQPTYNPSPENGNNNQPPSPTTTQFTTSTYMTTEVLASVIEATSTYSSDGQMYTTTYAVGTTTMTTAHSVATAVAISPDKKGTSAKVGPIVGGVIASVAGLGIIGFLIWYFIRRQREKVLNDVFDGNFDPRRASQLPPKPNNINSDDDGMGGRLGSGVGGVIAPFQYVPAATDSPRPSESASSRLHLTQQQQNHGSGQWNGAQMQQYYNPAQQPQHRLSVYSNAPYTTGNVGPGGRPGTGGSMTNSDVGTFSANSASGAHYANVPAADPHYTPQGFGQNVAAYPQLTQHVQPPFLGEKQQQQQQQLAAGQGAFSNPYIGGSAHPDVYDPYHNPQQQQQQQHFSSPPTSQSHNHSTGGYRGTSMASSMYAPSNAGSGGSGPGSVTNSSSAGGVPLNPKEREAYGAVTSMQYPGAFAVSNPDEQMVGGSGSRPSLAVNRDSYLKNGPGPQPQPAIVLHDAGRVTQHEATPQPAEEIPPTYDSLPENERR